MAHATGDRYGKAGCGAISLMLVIGLLFLIGVGAYIMFTDLSKSF